MKAVQWLYSTIYPIKFCSQEKDGQGFCCGPFGGTLWADDMEDLSTETGTNGNGG